MPALILLMVLALIGLPQALASTGDLNPFNAKYNTSGTRLDTCKVCHTTGANLNLYGMDMSNQTGTIEQRLANIELLDSDGDGFSNIDEITSLTFPGDFADAISCNHLRDGRLRIDNFFSCTIIDSSLHDQSNEGTGSNKVAPQCGNCVSAPACPAGDQRRFPQCGVAAGISPASR